MVLRWPCTKGHAEVNTSVPLRALARLLFGLEDLHLRTCLWR